jgi:thiamine-phosphate pyrophosphorylase
MRIVVISPETADSREIPAMSGFFSAGLERYHVRKPSWSAMALEAWLGHLPDAWRPRIVLHQHHELVAKLGLGGAHDRDVEGDESAAGCSRSCHDVPSLRRHLARYPSLFFGPIFPSLTKQGYRPAPDFPWEDLKRVLRERSPSDARVLAIGGITADGLRRCFDLGFDGAAVLGAVWNEMDPVGAYREIRDVAARLRTARHAA